LKLEKVLDVGPAVELELVLDASELELELVLDAELELVLDAESPVGLASDNMAASALELAAAWTKHKRKAPSPCKAILRPPGRHRSSRTSPRWPRRSCLLTQ